jgi:hypothetical protein
VKHLLPQVEKYFKTNLHTHSTISDGIVDRWEVKAAYKAAGYSVLAMTDHNVIYDHSDMNDPDFLMLTGIEINHNCENYRPRFDGQVYHFNLIAKDPTNTWTPNKILKKYPGAVGFEEGMTCEHMDMSYSVEAANAMIAKANEKGFLVMYNHPTWSCQTWEDYAPLKGLWAMELRNGACSRKGNDLDNSKVYRELVNLGNRIFPVGADDSHNPEDNFRAWIMLGAEKLEYRAVIEALEKGDFYMSCGPEIHSITIDGTTAKLTCSPATHIVVQNHGRFARPAFAPEGETITEAEFDLSVFFKKSNGDPDHWIRFVVTDQTGHYAATRAYYVPEMLTE